MERKVASTVELTREEVKTSVGKARLSGEEERALRMRFGESVEKNAPLARAAGSNAELADELLVLEMQLMKAMRARQAKAQPAAVVAPAPTANVDSRAKNKIVRALRTKK